MNNKKILLLIIILAISACVSSGDKSGQKKKEPEIDNGIIPQRIKQPVLVEEDFLPGEHEFEPDPRVTLFDSDQIDSKQDTPHGPVLSKAEILYNKGAILLRKGKYDEAETKFRAALESYPGYENAIGSLALIFRLRGEYQNAIDYYNKLLELSPENYFGLQNLAAVYLLNRNYPEAEAVYRKMQLLNPANPEAYYGIGRVNIYLKNYNKALEALLESEKLYGLSNSSHLKDTYFLAGFCYYEQDDYENALIYFLQAYPFRADSPELNYYIGISYLSRQEKDTQNAREYLSKAREYGFNIPDKVYKLLDF